jgi:hypothetical protein
MEHSPRKRGHRKAMIWASTLYGLALLPTGFMAVMSPMASDAGVNTKVWTFMIAMATWPLGFIVAIVLGWLFFGLRWPRGMWFAIALPWLWLVPIIWSMDFGR